MTEFMLAAALLVGVTVAAGLFRVLRGPTGADRIMAAQLLGTGGIAALLLLGVATANPALADVALILAVLAAFASVAMARVPPPRQDRGGPQS